MSKFRIHYNKPNSIDLPILAKQYQEEHKDAVNKNYNPYEIDKLQLYQPLYKLFFEMNETNYRSIALNHKYHIIDLHHVTNNKEIHEKDIFMKFSPLLDPYRFMIGKYNLEDKRIYKLPSLQSSEIEVHPKILLYHNASYIDSFFCFLTSVALNNHHIQHGVDFYGSYLGIQKQHKVNLTDDVEYLRNSDYFNDNIGKLFYIEDTYNDFSVNPFLSMENSRKNKKKLEFGQDPSLEFQYEELLDDFGTSSNQDTDLEIVYNKSLESFSSESSSSSDTSDSEVSYSSEEDELEEDSEDSEKDDSEETSSSSEEEEEEQDIFGYIHNFPMQMICMEKCDGTLDELFVKDEIDEKIGASILFQIVMTLLIYQQMFHFTHNDLHTNNIMYVNTNEPYLYYSYKNVNYKVPTYGKIYKIIDFGRAIFKFQGHQFCSDSFAKEGDASTQYNCEPFMNEDRPRLEPNNSFDLCRLGCSLFDFVTDIDQKEEDLDELQKTVLRWCLDDNGKNVLYKKNGQERYPSFKLYKMIARNVHNHSPEKQLDFPFFTQFKVSLVEKECLQIDELPCYCEKQPTTEFTYDQ